MYGKAITSAALLFLLSSTTLARPLTSSTLQARTAVDVEPEWDYGKRAPSDTDGLSIFSTDTKRASTDGLGIFSTSSKTRSDAEPEWDYGKREETDSYGIRSNEDRKRAEPDTGFGAISTDSKRAETDTGFGLVSTDDKKRSEIDGFGLISTGSKRSDTEPEWDYGKCADCDALFDLECTQ